MTISIHVIGRTNQGGPYQDGPAAGPRFKDIKVRKVGVRGILPMEVRESYLMRLKLALLFFSSLRCVAYFKFFLVLHMHFIQLSQNLRSTYSIASDVHCSTEVILFLFVLHCM